MKLFISILFVFTIIQNISSQVTSEQTNYNYKIAYCVGTQNSTAWIGKTTVVMIENETPSDRNLNYMEQTMEVFDNIYDGYENITGLDNLPNLSEYKSKTVIEVVLDNCGAGGLAHHGSKGMSTGVDLFNRLYNSIANNDLAVPQVFFYEINRNFWSPSFNNKFDWAMNNEPANWGWWTVGMNNAQAVMLSASLNYELDYFGQDRQGFRDRMVKELTSYQEDTQYDFEYGWKQSLMPWHNTESINDLMSGLLIYSYENFGGNQWLTNLYNYLKSDEIPDRTDVFSFQECRDNIYKIWSLSAETDLISFFENELRWSISQEAQDEISVTLGTIDIEKNEVFLSVYPNPANNTINIFTKTNITVNSLSIYNVVGQEVLTVINKEELNNTVIDISNLESGIYFIKHDDFTSPFVKR